ncbi:MAG TPA: DEAD/DEAH box helicase family protein, partial [Terrimicrobiaceae bacterium]
MRGAFRGGRREGSHVHGAQGRQGHGKGVVVSSLRSGLERRRRQSAKPGRVEDRLPLEAHPDPIGFDGDSGELRADRGGGEPEDREEEAGADFSALSPDRRGAEASGRCARERRGPAYLIQHSAGSGKSNSIAWLAHQLISARKDGKEVFDSIIVVTDRRILDKQIRETIKGFAQVGSIIGAVKEGAGVSKTEQLSKFLKDGKKIIISTVQTFPFVLDSIGAEHRGGNFAIIID